MLFPVSPCPGVVPALHTNRVTRHRGGLAWDKDTRDCAHSSVRAELHSHLSPHTQFFDKTQRNTAPGFLVPNCVTRVPPGKLL